MDSVSYSYYLRRLHLFDLRKIDILEWAWSLAVVSHFILAYQLYSWTTRGGANNCPFWTISQLAAVTSAGLYIGTLTRSYHWWKELDQKQKQEPGHDLIKLCYVLSITLPTLSAAFSSIGLVEQISRIFSNWRKEENKGSESIDEDEVILVIFYLLNILYLAIFTWDLGLWSGGQQQKCPKTQKSKHEKKGKTKKEHHKHQQQYSHHATAG